MTLSYDFLHEHAIGRTSNESARTTMRSIVHLCIILCIWEIIESGIFCIILIDTQKGKGQMAFILRKGKGQLALIT